MYRNFSIFNAIFLYFFEKSIIHKDYGIIMRHRPANDTVRHQLLKLRITRQAGVEYFKFQMAVTAAKKFFGTFLTIRCYLSEGRITTYSYI